MHHPQKSIRVFVFIIILLTAVFFRVNNLDSAPPGLYPNEAINGNDAIRVLDSDKPQVFYPENNGREGLHIWLIAFSFKLFGVHHWALRLPTIVFGIFGVIAVYLLAKEMFRWEIGALAAFLMAISFWHVNFSRIAFSGILAPTIFTFCLYFLWKGLKGKHFCNYFFSGLFLGLGFYTYIAFRVTPLIIALGLLVYWQFLKKDFDRKEYRHSRDFITRGIILLLVTTAIVALPLTAYFWTHPAEFGNRISQISFFSFLNPIESLKILFKNIGQTLAMFNFEGDHNWRHNFAGRSTLLWPVGVLFVFGFLRSIIKFFKQRFPTFVFKGRFAGLKQKLGTFDEQHKKDHGHYSTPQTFLLAWFLLGLAPAFLSNEGLPHALRSILAAPAVFIFAGEGCWWFFNWLKNWYGAYDKHLHEASMVTALVLTIFLASLAVAEYKKYFIDWAQNPETASAFNQNYAEIGKEINALPQNVPKYVVVYAPGVLVNNIPMPAQTIMFETQTYSPEKQKEKKVFYLTPEEWLQQKRSIFTSNQQIKVFELR